MPKKLALAPSIDALLEDPRPPEPCTAALGRIVALDGAGGPLVVIDGQPGDERRSADSTVALSPASVGARVTLLLPASGSPVVTGVVRPAGSPALAGAAPAQVVLDGETLVLEAQREIVLRCGKASIHLTREGKVVIRGADLLEASTGRHRIRGGTVEIN